MVNILAHIIGWGFVIALVLGILGLVAYIIDLCRFVLSKKKEVHYPGGYFGGLSFLPSPNSDAISSARFRFRQRSSHKACAYRAAHSVSVSISSETMSRFVLMSLST